jgi:hypothetical protein
MGMDKEAVTLSNQEALALVLLILDGCEAIEDGDLPRDTWTGEMRLWIALILNRMEGGS